MWAWIPGVAGLPKGYRPNSMPSLICTTTHGLVIDPKPAA